MTNRQSTARAVVVFDPATGSILHVHFTESPRPGPGAADPAEKAALRFAGADTANVRLLHVAPGGFKPEQHYRVDPASGKLVPTAAGQHGFTGSAGSTRR